MPGDLSYWSWANLGAALSTLSSPAQFSRSRDALVNLGRSIYQTFPSSLLLLLCSLFSNPILFSYCCRVLVEWGDSQRAGGATVLCWVSVSSVKWGVRAYVRVAVRGSLQRLSFFVWHLL